MPIFSTARFRLKPRTLAHHAKLMRVLEFEPAGAKQKPLEVATKLDVATVIARLGGHDTHLRVLPGQLKEARKFVESAADERNRASKSTAVGTAAPSSASWRKEVPLTFTGFTYAAGTRVMLVPAPFGIEDGKHAAALAAFHEVAAADLKHKLAVEADIRTRYDRRAREDPSGDMLSSDQRRATLFALLSPVLLEPKEIRARQQVEAAIARYSRLKETNSVAEEAVSLARHVLDSTMAHSTLVSFIKSLPHGPPRDAVELRRQFDEEDF